ncbi:hypothetical protein C1N80_14035 [Brachybacterium sp. SGAir0954]|nr:hypothetical protein C1N80_14035 [Brachybacterium sp. SGAir0954]
MRTEMTRREREAAAQTDSDLKLVAREIAPFMRSRGFAKAGPVTWRRDRPELQSRLSLRAGTPAQGPFAKISGTVHVELVASPPGPRFRESIIRTHPEIMSRDDAYLIRDADDRTALLEDLTTQLVPWLLHYDSFDAMWRALLHGEPPAAGEGAARAGRDVPGPSARSRSLASTWTIRGTSTRPSSTATRKDSCSTSTGSTGPWQRSVHGSPPVGDTGPHTSS